MVSGMYPSGLDNCQTQLASIFVVVVLVALLERIYAVGIVVDVYELSSRLITRLEIVKSAAHNATTTTLPPALVTVFIPTPLVYASSQ